MAEIIEMPKLSDTMTTGTLVSWLKKEGDAVSTGDMIAEVETDKATMEVESFADGVLLKQYLAPGVSVPVGGALCAIGEEGEEAPKAEAAAPAEVKEEPAPAKEEASKPAAEAPKAEEPKPTPAPVSVEESSDGRVTASPLARKMAADKGIPLAAIKGTGPGGRIVKKDVELAIDNGVTASSAAGTPETIAVAQVGEFNAARIADAESQPVTGMRSAIARRLLESKTTIPHFYLEVEVDAAPLAKIRAKINEKLVNLEPEKGGIKVTVNDLILKATSEALRRTPALNASWMGDHIQQHGSVHLAFGVAVDDGLVTPVIRDAQAKTLRQVSAEAKSLIGKARNKKLKPDEMSGSTFTVTNLGMFGVKNFFGIINPPNAGILSVAAAAKVPVVAEDGSITVGQRMQIGFSGDHRVVDGATGAQFLAALKEILETPEIMLV